jgi:hypothetical protein
MAAFDMKKPSIPFPTLWPAAICVLIVGLLAIWPGDAPWGGDDVVLISTAIKANHEHHLIAAGLGGSFGYPYGPIPSQIYQMLVMFSHDPVVLVRLHAVLFAAAVAGALLYLAAVMNLSPWMAPMTMVGPFFFFYSRLMWDNTFAIPVGTLLLASYGDCLRRSSRAAFFTAVSCAIALPLIHPMTLPLVIPVVIHALIFKRDAIKKHWPGLIVIALCAAICSGAYVQRVADQLRQSPNLIPPRADALTRAQAAVFPLFAGRLFSAHGFFDERGPEMGWEQNRLVEISRLLSTVSYPLIWLGMFAAIARIRNLTPVPALCLGTLLLQSLMDARLRISPYPHYYSGTWAAAVVFLWMGLDLLGRFKLRSAIGLTYAIVMVISTIAFAVDIHRQGGGLVWYGPSLGTQLRENKEAPDVHPGLPWLDRLRK